MKSSKWAAVEAVLLEHRVLTWLSPISNIIPSESQFWDKLISECKIMAD